MVNIPVAEVITFISTEALAVAEYLTTPILLMMLVIIFSGYIAYIALDESYIASALVQFVVMIILLITFPWILMIFIG